MREPPSTPPADHADAPPRLALRPADAARALGVSARKLWEITADQASGIPVIRWGKVVVYPVRELADWLAEQVQRKGGDRR